MAELQHERQRVVQPDIPVRLIEPHRRSDDADGDEDDGGELEESAGEQPCSDEQNHLVDEHPEVKHRQQVDLLQERGDGQQRVLQEAALDAVPLRGDRPLAHVRDPLGQLAALDRVVQEEVLKREVLEPVVCRGRTVLQTIGGDRVRELDCDECEEGEARRHPAIRTQELRNSGTEATVPEFLSS